MRIRETVKILGNFRELRDENRPRSSYINEFANDLSQAYDYNLELVEIILDLFNPAEALEFIEANEA